MINCIQCQKEISDEARTCPQCGQPQFIVSTFTNIIVMLILSFVFIGAILHFAGVESQKLDICRSRSISLNFFWLSKTKNT